LETIIKDFFLLFLALYVGKKKRFNPKIIRFFKKLGVLQSQIKRKVLPTETFQAISAPVRI